MEVLNCPACGASLNINIDNEYVKCEFCGNTLRIKRRDVNSDGSISISDKSTGMAIGAVKLPFGCNTIGMLLPAASSYAYPFGVSASAYDENGSVVSYFIGEAFCDRSKCPMLSGPYSQGLEQISRVHYRDFCDIRRYIDGYASMYASNAKATALRFSEERSMPLYEPFSESEALENYRRRVEFEKQRNGNNGMAQDTGFYLKGLCRVYDMTVNSLNFKFAVTTVLEGWRYRINVPDMSFSGLGTLFGGLFSGRAAQPQQSQTSAFNDMPLNSVIDWQSEGIFILQCFPQNFESAFKGMYTDFCSAFRLDNSIKEKMYNMQSQIIQDIARHTQQNIDRMNRQFQSWQQLHATQQAAFDSYNRAWWSRTNAADTARRSAYQSKMAAEDRMSEQYSEAVRGVNTYIRPDGTEVEVSVAYDRAYTNNSGDTLGSNSAFEPDGSWTEMNKKR